MSKSSVTRRRGRAPVTDQRHLLDAATRRVHGAVGSVVDPVTKQISFEDLEPNSFHMPAGWVPARGADQLDHRAVAEVTAELAASVGRHAAPAKPETAEPKTNAAVPDLRALRREASILVAEASLDAVHMFAAALDRVQVELDDAVIWLGIAAADLALCAGGRAALLAPLAALNALAQETAVAA